MKFRHKTFERSGTFGGRSFVVQLAVQLDEEEAKVRSAYGFYERMELGDKFKDTKGVDILGDISLGNLLGQTREFKFPTIQMAGMFVDGLKEGLEGIKSQILATQTRIENLNRDFEVDI
jgi:hypothetical protein